MTFKRKLSLLFATILYMFRKGSLDDRYRVVRLLFSGEEYYVYSLHACLDENKGVKHLMIDPAIYCDGFIIAQKREQ